MALRDVFHKAANTVFKVFASLIKEGDYTQVTDDGFDVALPTLYPVNIIMASFTQEDIQKSSMSALIQPNDFKGLIKGEELADVDITKDDFIMIGSTEYGVVAFETDPAEALYIFLLRKT